MDIETISAANNQFALNVFKHLYESHKGVNTFLSPLLLTTSLGITYMGARGETQRGIAKTLGWEMTADEKCLVQLENYIKAVREECGDHVTMSSGIKILLDKKWSCLEEFKRSIERFEFTEIVSYDSLQDCEQVVKDVHRWIADTNKSDANDDLKLDSALQSQKMSLVSCVYFKGKWDRGFDVKNTQLLPFVVAPGTSEDVPMMCITGRYPYIKDNDLRYSAIELPYQGGHLGVVIILPDEYFGLGDLLRNINLETVTELLKNLYMADSAINLIVPKFKIRNTFQLAPVVSQLGMDDAFQPDRASFGGMVSPGAGLSLSAVIHAASVLVDEEGTTPAASKNSKTRAKAGCSNILKVRVDHPFLYAVVDKRISNTFLYIGHVSNPIL